jgi:hypothetical protein
MPRRGKRIPSDSQPSSDWEVLVIQAVSRKREEIGLIATPVDWLKSPVFPGDNQRHAVFPLFSSSVKRRWKLSERPDIIDFSSFFRAVSWFNGRATFSGTTVMRSRAILFLAATFASPALAESPKSASDASRETWETVFVRDKQGRDQQIGFSSLTLTPIIENGKSLIRATRELNLTIKREGQTAQLKATTGADETTDGKVVGVFMRQWIGVKQALTMRGIVDDTGKKIKISVESNVKNEFENPWDNQVIGLSAESALLRERKVKPGDTFSYRVFEPTISHVATVKIVAREVEEVLLPRGGKQRLLRVESTPEKIQDVQLPASTIWVDPQTFETVMTQVDMPGIGLLSLLRSTKQAATGPLGDAPDLMRMQTIRLGQSVKGGVHPLRSVTYQITIADDTDPEKIFKPDSRQKITRGEGRTFELAVEAIRGPSAVAKPQEAAEEFTKSNFYINCDDEQVKKLALAAVGKLTDPWEKAKAIERFVRANMKGVNFTEGMATADHVAKTLSGDCSEYSMLSAAMCRAVGIPSRTAIGLVYVEPPPSQPGALAFHMWTEVYVQGQWLGIDSTLGRGGIGPGHLKITDHSWHEVHDFKPLLPVTGFMLAKPKIEIKSAVSD